MHSIRRKQITPRTFQVCTNHWKLMSCAFRSAVRTWWHRCGRTILRMSWEYVWRWEDMLRLWAGLWGSTRLCTRAGGVHSHCNFLSFHRSIDDCVCILVTSYTWRKTGRLAWRLACSMICFLWEKMMNYKIICSSSNCATCRSSILTRIFCVCSATAPTQSRLNSDADARQIISVLLFKMDPTAGHVHVSIFLINCFVLA